MSVETLAASRQALAREALGGRPDAAAAIAEQPVRKSAAALAGGYR
jgi:hypothetical protein